MALVHPAAQHPAPVRLKLARNVRRLLADPTALFEEFGNQMAGGAVGTFRLGTSRAVVITDPELFKRVFVDEHDKRYVREGAMWRPLMRLNGDGLAGNSLNPNWRRTHNAVAPLFRRVAVKRLVETMAVAIDKAVTALEAKAAGGVIVDSVEEMTRIVHAALISAFFGQRIDPGDARRLALNIDKAFNALNFRLAAPWWPEKLHAPGDGSFMAAVAEVDEIMYPLVNDIMEGGEEDAGLLYWLSGKSLSSQEIRDSLVTLFVGGSEPTALALSWLWVALQDQPQIAARLVAEVDEVCGKEPPGLEHLPGLDYVRRALKEILRLFPGGWMLPRQVIAEDVLGGVRVRSGDTVFASPYLTHRRPDIYENPLAFDPDRWLPHREEGLHSHAYQPFGGGKHRCLGEHLYTMEGQVIVARILQRSGPEVVNPGVKPKAQITLRPADVVQLRLHTR